MEPRNACGVTPCASCLLHSLPFFPFSFSCSCSFLFLFLFLLVCVQGWGLNPGPQAATCSPLSRIPNDFSFISRQVLVTKLPRLAWNMESSCLGLLSGEVTASNALFCREDTW